MNFFKKVEYNIICVDTYYKRCYNYIQEGGKQFGCQKSDKGT